MYSGKGRYFLLKMNKKGYNTKLNVQVLICNQLIVDSATTYVVLLL